MLPLSETGSRVLCHEWRAVHFHGQLGEGTRLRFNPDDPASIVEDWDQVQLSSSGFHIGIGRAGRVLYHAPPGLGRLTARQLLDRRQRCMIAVLRFPLCIMTFLAAFVPPLS